MVTVDDHADTAYLPSGDYSKATLDCDLVMKGGITSGVIYPLAICKLAEKYRLHSIGGASAGAIAAAAAAAAEYARQHGSDKGYASLEKLPDELAARTPSERTRLLSLFQPSSATKTAFDAVLIAVRKTSALRKLAALTWLVARRHVLFPVIGIATAALLVLSASAAAWQIIVAAAGALLALVAGLTGGAIVTVSRAYRAIARNRGGICSGYAANHPPGEPALCEWLADLIDRIAGVPGDEPLTFGKLREQDIHLAMITTNLSHGRPYRLPFVSDAGFFFKKHEIEALFPARIASVLVKAGYASLDTASAEIRQTFADNGGRASDYVPLPPGDQIPVVFGVRLSLSFPILLSAVPLYAVDWTSVRHPDLDKPENLEAKSSRPSQEFPKEGPLELSPCWFSDGGICSNLPIHFFDALLPRWPTFALNLRLAHPQYRVWTPDSKDPGSELDNVWVPESPNAGYAESWERSEKVGVLSAVELFKTMINTMQNWNDNMLAKAPGYRDRIVHISHAADEGGMNLEMPLERIKRLGIRGAAAGHKIGARFDRRSDSDGWQSHLWVRYRAALGMLQDLLSKAHQRYFVDPKGKAELDTLLGAPSRFDNREEAEAAKGANAAFTTFSGLDPNQINFVERAPRPNTELRPRPRDG